MWLSTFSIANSLIYLHSEEVGHKNQILELVNENLLVVLLWHTEADLLAWGLSETQYDSRF